MGGILALYNATKPCHNHTASAMNCPHLVLPTLDGMVALVLEEASLPFTSIATARRPFPFQSGGSVEFVHEHGKVHQSNFGFVGWVPPRPNRTPASRWQSLLGGGGGVIGLNVGAPHEHGPTRIS